MKYLLTIFLIPCTILFSSCFTKAPFFTSPNYLGNITGKLHLNTGEVIEGALSVDLNNIFDKPIKILKPGDKDPLKYRLMEVSGYELRGNYYELKEIRKDFSASTTVSSSFMKMLTPSSYSIRLYENIERVSGSTTTSSSMQTVYYIKLPDDRGGEVWALDSRRLSPNFNEKMSVYVKDCPVLYNKVFGKMDGYWYPEISIYNTNERRLEVVMRIINEYNNCK